MLPPVSSSPWQLLSSSQDELPRVLHRNRSSRTLLSLFTIKSSPVVYCSVVLCTPGQPLLITRFFVTFSKSDWYLPRTLSAYSEWGILSFLHFLLLLSWVFHILPSVILCFFMFSPLLSLPFQFLPSQFFKKILFTVHFFSRFPVFPYFLLHFFLHLPLLNI